MKPTKNWHNLPMRTSLASLLVWLALGALPAFAQAKPCDYSGAAIGPLRQKLAFSAKPTFQQLTDAERADDAQQAALIELDRARIRCANEKVKDFTDAPADAISAFNRAVNLDQTARADLFTGKTTFGEYNREVQRIAAELDTTLEAIDRREQPVRQAGAQGSIARSAAAGAQRALPTYNAFPKPLICTSTRRGTLVDTYCR